MGKIKHNTIALCKEREKVKLINAPRTWDAQKEIELIHNKGFIIFAIKDDKWQQWSLRKEDINNSFLQNLLGLNKDTYMSINSFKTYRRLISNLFSLNALWSDLDYYNTKYKNKTYEEIIEIVSKNKLIKKIPPSFWVYSGKGLYPIWLLEDAHAKSCIAIWRKLMNTIQAELEKYGADSKSAEPAHVLRLAGSINNKTNVTAKIIRDFTFNPKRYTITEIADLILPKLEYDKKEWKTFKQENRRNSRKNKKQKESNIIKSQFNIHTLNYARLQDIQALIELRDGDCEGYREELIFLYRYWANCYHSNPEKALEETMELNKLFKNPLNDAEVINATKRAEDASEIWEIKFKEYVSLEKKPKVKTFFENTGCYVYSNKTLIKLLNITYGEMIAKAPDGSYMLSTMINTKAKNYRAKDYRAKKQRDARRNENGLTSREQAKMDKIYAILNMIEQGLKQTEMAKKLGITRQAVSKLIKEIRENNIVKPVEITEIEDNVIELNRVTDSELSLIVV